MKLYLALGQIIDLESRLFARIERLTQKKTLLYTFLI